MPWPNLTPQELAAYQMLSGGNPQMGQAQGMNPQMLQAYQAMLAQQQQPMTGQMGMQQPSMANMLAARPNSSGGMMNLPTPGAGFNPSAGNNMSTILNNPHLLQLLMSQYGGGAT